MRFLLFVILIPLFLCSLVRGADSDIRLNSLGFLPDMPKKAAVITACSTFSVINVSNNKAIFQGEVSGPQYQKDVDQEVWDIDFSEVTESGTYCLDIPGVGRSINFKIGNDVFDFALFTCMRGFYLIRCGTAVQGEHQGALFAHGACHMEDGWVQSDDSEDIQRDGTGGWHDAGDYGKYIINAGVTVGVLLLGWEHFQERLETMSFNLPETAPNYPDFLAEIKWETDWLLKMALPGDSGKVSHKLTRKSFSGFIMPEDDSEKRYFVDWSTVATANFAAMMAMASRAFKPYDAEYATLCLNAAKRSYGFLKQHPGQKHANQREFRTGGYASKDEDDRLWAAAELWESTGDAQYLKDFEKMAVLESKKIEPVFDWGNVGNLGMFRYLFSKRRGRNDALVNEIQNSLVAVADSLVKLGKNDVYDRTLAERYWWGCNGALARQAVLLYVANQVSPDTKYVTAALNDVDHLFGRNAYGRSYVTGLGHLPPMYPHDRRSGADDVEPPWPGYIVGGGESALGWHDEQQDYRTNEICINWQGALVYALAWMASVE